jgi:glycine/D-amino acid oxidase-like deaminating enzyme
VSRDHAEDPAAGHRAGPAPVAGHWEVVVVGGRIAGASTAWALAPYAERILVVDASRPTALWPQQSTWAGGESIS